MGEANRRKTLIAESDCICGSGRRSNECCFTNGFWHKRPTSINLNIPGNTLANDKCYMSTRLCCSKKRSREHLISRAVLDALSEKSIYLEGLPWIGRNEKRLIGIDNIVAKCLCKDHNTALSNLDNEMGRFTRALRDATVGDQQDAITTIFSGHDIERWILKTHLALSHSGNIATDDQVVVPEYGDLVRCLELLETPSGWNLPMGLYLHGEIGKIVSSSHQLSFYPLYNDTDAEMLGMIMEIYGLRFGLLFSPRKAIADALYRPGLIEIVIQNRRHNIFISWNDEIRHGGITLRN